MKLRFNTLLWVALLCGVNLAVSGEDFTRKFSQSWPAAGVETLKISNRFGEVKVNDAGGNTITVDVVVSVEGSESKAKSILDDITVAFGKEGNTASAETKIKDGFKTNGRFTIDYTVNIPSEKNLEISNKYGNLVVNKLTGKGDFNVAYGNMTANSLTGPETHLDLAYGNADIQTMAKAEVEASYFKLILGTATSVKMESKYSGFTIDKLEDLTLNSKYDNFTIDEIGSFEGNSRFTSYKIGKLTKKLKLETGYGPMKVDHIPAGFELVDVTSSYTQVSLGIDANAGYQLDARCDYCEISYPKDAFKGNREEENTRKSLSGKVGSGSPGTVRVVSSYGNIRLAK
jgi:hypothetical protein